MKNVQKYNSNKSLSKRGRVWEGGDNFSFFFFRVSNFCKCLSTMCKWIDIYYVMHNDECQHMEQFENILCGGKSISNKLAVIWFTCVWCIWKSKTDKVFQNEKIIIEKVVNEAKMCCFKWLKLKLILISDDISQLYMNPKACISIMNVWK